MLVTHVSNETANYLKHFTDLQDGIQLNVVPKTQLCNRNSKVEGRRALSSAIISVEQSFCYRSLETC